MTLKPPVHQNRFQEIARILSSDEPILAANRGLVARWSSRLTAARQRNKTQDRTMAAVCMSELRIQGHRRAVGTCIPSLADNSDVASLWELLGCLRCTSN